MKNLLLLYIGYATEVDFSTIFSSYKSPELKFDPFKVFETESSTSGSGGGSSKW